MPLFNFKCLKCELVVEKFQRGKTTPELTCECGHEEFEKLPASWKNMTQLNSRDLYDQKIAPDARRILNDVKGGNDNTFLDVYGEK